MRRMYRSLLSGVLLLSRCSMRLAHSLPADRLFAPAAREAVVAGDRVRSPAGRVGSTVVEDRVSLARVVGVAQVPLEFGAVETDDAGAVGSDAVPVADDGAVR